MADTILFVDYENIQAVDLSTIPANARIVLVLGAKQSKLPTEPAMQAQLLGDRFAYFQIDFNSRTASISASRSISVSTCSGIATPIATSCPTTRRASIRWYNVL